MIKKSSVKNLLRVTFIFLLGALTTVLYQKIVEWNHLYNTPYVHSNPHDKEVVFKDIENVFESLMIKHKLTSEEFSWFIYKQGFSGFVPPLFQKGSVVLGDGYQTTVSKASNQVFLKEKKIEIGNGTEIQLSIIDKDSKQVIGVIGISEKTDINELEYLLFTPEHIYQFNMNSIFGIKSVRKF